MKIGDRVRCIKNDYGINIGQEYVITRGKFRYGIVEDLCVDVDGKGPYYANNFALINNSMEELLALAKSYIGKTVTYKDVTTFKVSDIGICCSLEKAEKTTSLVYAEFMDKGFCVYVSGSYYSVPVQSVELCNMIEVKLNDRYTAKVYEDKIEVGCQIFPISILDELMEAKNAL